MTDPHVPISPAAWRELFAAAAQIAELAPWEFATDGELFGLTDPVTNEVRIGHILGNAGIIFGAVIYRDKGIHWLLSTLEGDSDESPDLAVESMDCIKLEWVRKVELTKEDKAAMSAAGFKATGRGPIWPQFRSSKPGWHPWHIDAAEAHQLVSDLAQLIAFLHLLKSNPTFFEGRSNSEIPFLRADPSSRGKTLKEVDWLPLVLSPEPSEEPEPLPEAVLKELNDLDRDPELTVEFDARLLFEASFKDEGRPCVARMGLLVESGSGCVESFDLQSATKPAVKTCHSCLAALLLKAQVIPGKLLVLQSRYHEGLKPLCSKLGIKLGISHCLPLVDEAFDSMAEAISRQ